VVTAGSDDAVTIGAEHGSRDDAPWMSGGERGPPVVASQMRALRSQLAVTTRVPSGLNAALSTKL
jgi:hypothetical protein